MSGQLFYQSLFSSVDEGLYRDLTDDEILGDLGSQPARALFIYLFIYLLLHPIYYYLRPASPAPSLL